MQPLESVVTHVFSAVAARRYDDVAPYVDAYDLARFHAHTLRRPGDEESNPRFSAPPAPSA